MGLKRTGLRLVAQHLGKRVLCLSYPDLVMPAGVVGQILNIEIEASTDFGGWHGVGYRLAETAEAFRKAGVEQLRFVDIAASRGCEEIADLNAPCDLGKHDLVLDPGTLEHCFNVGQAFLNAANAVEVGGKIVHCPPVTMTNHGFWGIQPTALYDFYTQNGWEILDMYLTNKAGDAFYKCPRTQRAEIPAEMSLLFAARRLVDAPLTWPTQTKYLKNPALK